MESNGSVYINKYMSYHESHESLSLEIRKRGYLIKNSPLMIMASPAVDFYIMSLTHLRGNQQPIQ